MKEPQSSCPTGARAPLSSGASVVVPTYREASNLAALARRVASVMAPNGSAWELVLVDDDSADGTEEIAAELAGAFPVRLHVRRGVPRDLSLAVLDGFEVARFDRLVVMDADLSHPPERIPALLAALDQGTVAIGSRYAPGGRLDERWGLWRRLVSRLATWLARPLGAGQDPMSGFFAIDRGTLPDRSVLRPLGYNIALELVVRGGLRVREVPIAFRDRVRGASKMGLRTQIAYLRHLHRLYLAKFGAPARVASFLAVGASGFVIDVACYLSLQAMGLDHRLTRFLSFWPAVTWNWRLNRGLTFAERPRRPAARQWGQFALTSLLGLGVNVGGYALLTTFVEAFAEHRLAALASARLPRSAPRRIVWGPLRDLSRAPAGFHLGGKRASADWNKSATVGGWSSQARPRKTAMARFNRTSSGAGNWPMRSPRRFLGTVVTLSTMSREVARNPFRRSGWMARRNRGASVASVVNAQTVTDAVESNRSS